MDKDIAENRAWVRKKRARRIGYLLSWLAHYGRSNSNVAGYLGVNRSTVSGWKHGTRTIGDRHLAELEKLLEEERKPVNNP